MIPSPIQPPLTASPMSPQEVDTTKDVHTGESPVNPVLKELQTTFLYRLNVAKHDLSKNPEAQQALTEALVNRFGIFQDSESDTENKHNFLAIALAQCNLADQEGIEILQQAVNLQNEISGLVKSGDTEDVQGKEHRLAELEKDLGAISRKDNNVRSGSFSMGVERQGFVEQHVEEWFPEDLRQPVKDALILLKNQMTSGADISPLPELVTGLKSGEAKDLDSFSAHFKYPNELVFKQAREEFLVKSSELDQHFVNKDDLPTVLAGKIQIPEDKMEQVTQALSRPVSEMSTEALVLAAIITHFSERDLKSYLKAAQILSLKTQAQKNDPELADNTAVAMGLERSDAMVREHFKGGAQFAAQSAADALLQSLTPLPEDMAAMV